MSAHQNGYSNAHVFSAEGQEFLVLAIGWNAEPGTWSWAQSVLEANPTLPTILTSHAIIDVDKETGEAADVAFGQEMWQELIRANDQIFVTLNGHFHGQTRRVVTNDAGNDVHQILLDSQMAADGGNGIMGMMEFDLANDRIDFATISPWVTQKDPETRTPSDTPVVSTPEADFSLEIDFSERFSFAPDFGPGDGSYGDLSERAKEIVSEGWDGGDGSTEAVTAGSRGDYVEVPGTLAHWRFGDQEEGVLPENAEITDETGDNPMYRLPVDQINAPAEVEDVTITHSDTSNLSADAGAVCFADASRNTGKLNYLTTEYETPVTHASFDEGYTIESFVYLADDWTVEDNQWGGWLSRTGRRSALPVAWERYDYEMGPAFFSVSNLKEFQWATTNGTSWTNTGSLWSGEIMTGNWYHVAAVNDAEAHTTTMYVDGVPVLRNATDLDGMTYAPGYPWMLGTVFNYDEASNGWNGCVGETRIVDHALDSSQFLHNRTDIDGDFSVVGAPSGDLPAGTQLTEFDGTGRPGTEVRIVDGAATGAAVAASTSAASSEAVLGSTTVSDDGTWSLQLDSAITEAGAYELSAVPSIGTRDGAAVALQFAIEPADSADGTDGATDGGTTDGATDGTSDAADGGTSGDGTSVDGTATDDATTDDDTTTTAADGDSLPATGLTALVWFVLASGLVALGVGAALRLRRRADQS